MPSGTNEDIAPPSSVEQSPRLLQSPELVSEQTGLPDEMVKAANRRKGEGLEADQWHAAIALAHDRAAILRQGTTATERHAVVNGATFSSREIERPTPLRASRLSPLSFGFSRGSGI